MLFQLLLIPIKTMDSTLSAAMNTSFIELKIISTAHVKNFMKVNAIYFIHNTKKNYFNKPKYL